MSYNEPPPPSNQPPSYGGGGGYGDQPPAYGGGQPAYGAQPTQSGKAIASMVTGLAGLLTFCCGFFVISSIVALVLGLMARKEIAASDGRLKGSGMALTGIITGIIGLVMLALVIVLVATGVIDFTAYSEVS